MVYNSFFIEERGVIMARGNDAIPSWSGFNYQGKMMLLCVLEEINRVLIKDGDLSLYEVELEKTEDFSLLQQGKYYSLYQVKASFSRNTWKEYKEALEKLLEHRNNVNAPSAACKFVVVKEIKNWSDASNIYKSSINIYKYDNKLVDVTDVKDAVIKEIRIILNSCGKVALNHEAVYGSLCIFLDNQIALMHKQNSSQRKYKISFSKILDIILSAVTKQNEDVEYVIKEKVYNNMLKTVKDSLCDICNKRCHASYDGCNKECPAKVAAESILSFSNIREYCQIVNPDKNCIWDNELSYANNFTIQDVEKYIIKVFADSNDEELVTSIKNIVGLKSCFNPLKSGVVIPTLVKFEEVYTNIEDSMQSKLQKIKDNNDVIHNLYGNTLVVDSSDYFNDITLSQTQISAAWSGINQNNIGAVEQDVGFVSYKELLNNFSKYGGNHE